jgi:ribosome biogenesis GTPase
MIELNADLLAYGWTGNLEAARKAAGRPDWLPGRVLSEQRHLYQVMTGQGELRAEVSGKFRTAATGTGDFPAVGDWVLVQGRLLEGTATIQALLPRFSRFSRKAAGCRNDEQVLAANIDTVFLVMSLNNDFNLRRLERFLVMAWDSGSQPVVVLTKRDLADDADARQREVEAVAAGVPVVAISAVTGEGMRDLEPWLVPGKTLVVLGSSGVGKSTLINRLAGSELALTKEIREDDSHGRHTTSHRELYLMDSGVLMLDTPGIRELQLWETETGLDETFQDIHELAAGCRFRDCMHRREPGCAVREALRSGVLDWKRYDSYHKLAREVHFINSKNSQPALNARQKDKNKLNPWRIHDL